MENNFDTLELGLSEEKTLDWLTGEIMRINAKGAKIVALVAGEAAGSTTLANKLAKKLRSAAVVSTDDALIGDRLYRRANLEGKPPLLKYNTELFERKIDKIRNLKNGETVKMPVYEQASGLACSVGEENFTREIGKVDCLIIEGAVHFIKDHDLLIFMEVPDEIRLQNRIKRGFAKRNEKSEEEIVKSFKLRHAKEYQAHILPIMKRSDILLKIKATLGGSDGFIYKYSIYLNKKNNKKGF
jgi:uridine kinase